MPGLKPSSVWTHGKSQWCLQFHLFVLSFMSEPKQLSGQTPVISQNIIHLSSFIWSIKLNNILINIVLLINQSVYVFLGTPCKASSSSCRAGSTDIPDPLSPLLPIVHRSRQVLRTTSRILTQLLNVCSSWSSCFCTAMCGGPVVPSISFQTFLYRHLKLL